MRVIMTPLFSLYTQINRYRTLSCKQASIHLRWLPIYLFYPSIIFFINFFLQLLQGSNIQTLMKLQKIPFLPHKFFLESYTPMDIQYCIVLLFCSMKSRFYNINLLVWWSLPGWSYSILRISGARTVSYPVPILTTLYQLPPAIVNHLQIKSHFTGPSHSLNHTGREEG
jgi:hypothetical protein